MFSFSVRPKSNSQLVLLLVKAAVCAFGWSNQSLAQKYSPEHPAVQEMVQNGIAYLASSKDGLSGEGVNLLAGYTIFKATGDPEHPVVVSAIKEARNLALLVSRKNTGEVNALYATSVAGMLLASVDVDAHGAQITQIINFLLASQKNHGGFGYLDSAHLNSGDISQTQYVMLCLWTMSQLGIDIPDEPVIGAINFLVAAQTVEGGWPYQFGDKKNETTIVTNSLSAAGLSGILIAGDLIGLYRNKVADNQEEEGIIPIAFRRIMPESKRTRGNIDRTKLDNAAKRGESWHNANPYNRASWHYYYVYSRERYESFLEITKGKQQKSPDWYNQAVEALQTAQSPSGAWGIKDSDSMIGPPVCTSFAILFLIRSTQKAIGALNEAYVVGGDSLPDDLTSVRAVRGKVMSKTTTTSIDDALKMLEEDGKNETEDELVADKMLLAAEPSKRKEQLNRFARLLNAKEPKTRKIAAKLLGRGDELDHVPALIYAITDPDPDIPRIAEQSLRLISRQLDTHYLPKGGDKLSDQTKSRASAQWKKWFLSLRPDYVFVD
ncbi:MAG TPA: hypothetical protein VM260_13270 [Pirellula sp.]|nr:hypothetical protein [Pirellula sp.]